MPPRKRKQVKKSKKQAKKKTVKTEKTPKKKVRGVKSKINRSDPLYQTIKQKYKSRHSARAKVESMGLPYRKIEGNIKATAQRNLIDAIYLETQKKIKIKSHKDIEGVEAVNIQEGGLITIKDQRNGDIIIVTDQNPDFVKEVRVDSKAKEGLIGFQSDTISDEKLTTTVQILPTVEKQIAMQKEIPIAIEEKEKPTGKVAVITDTYSQMRGNKLLPTRDEPPGKTRIKKNREKLIEYNKRNWIPFYYPNNSKDLIEPKKMDGVREVDYLAEKEALLPKKKGKYAVQTGQHIQTQVFDIPARSGNFDWVGLYFQKRSGATRNKPIPTIVKAKQIRADNDDAGHFIAYINNMYAFNNPLKKNFKVEGEAKPKVPDEFRAMRFLAKSVINSLGVKRNLAIADAIKNNLGEKALKYRTDMGLRPLVISEQIVEIVKLAGTQKIVARVNVADRAPIDFDVDLKRWDEEVPNVKFVETGKIDETTGKIEVYPLDSDSLLKIIVRKYGIDMVSGQRMLETLHNQEWITYPRADVQKAEDVPIRIMSDKKRKALEEIIKRQEDKEKIKKPKKPGEQLTVQEFEVLKIVYEAEKASDRKENYVKNGYWELKSGNLALRKKDTILASEMHKYTPNLFDIEIKKKTLDENEMLSWLVDNNVGTPATRSAQIERLRNAGIIVFREGNYVIDRRGYYMVAAHNVMTREEVPLVKDLLKQADNVVYNDYSMLNQIVNSFRFIDRQKLANETAKEAKKLIEAEHDLTYLESF